jgi:hypothetical protein
MRSLHEVRFPLSTEEASDSDDRRPADGADEAILSALNENPFPSVRQLSRIAQTPEQPSTVT